MRAIRFVGLLIAWPIAFVCALWAIGAFYFDFPIPALRVPIAIGLALALLAAGIFVRGKFWKLASVLAGFGLVLAWWLTLKPSNDRPWQPDVSETGWAEINGDDVAIHNVRNCDYRTETDYTPRWETRTVNLSQLSGLNIAITYWGSPYMAHPIVSFEFADSPPICFSIETRKEIGETYSAIAGFYRQYELIFICADERDVIRVRTNYRQDEDVYLYRVLLPPKDVRERFLEYLKSLNALHSKPRWYNAATTNCTTTIREQHLASKRIAWDWRILINGKGDELLYERHLIATDGLPFAELKERSHINDRARAADQDPEFSRRIREGVPVFHSSEEGR
jgi:hypothetical protein